MVGAAPAGTSAEGAAGSAQDCERARRPAGQLPTRPAARSPGAAASLPLPAGPARSELQPPRLCGSPARGEPVAPSGAHARPPRHAPSLACAVLARAPRAPPPRTPPAAPAPPGLRASTQRAAARRAQPWGAAAAAAAAAAQTSVPAQPECGAGGSPRAAGGA
ncbi:nematocyst expressed protein 3-like [Meles meles]|uniref:nematocyst expressed protein 3-like n=1 Tax=Meles meles TaxID=9662 RepID=UPI001E6A0132|nr:nematocyst expressed protein 3-like [Meles meles]